MSTRGRGSGSGLCLGADLIDERIHKFVTFEITRGILDVTHVMFGIIKEGIMELLDEQLGAFYSEI